MANEKRGPHLVAAVFCERDLVEADGVHSLVRIVDAQNFVVSAPTTVQEERLMSVPLALGLTFFMSVWAEHDGAHKLSVDFVYEDDGQRIHVGDAEVNLSAGKGLNFAIPIQGSLPRLGRIWAEVAIDGEVRTRSPLMLSRTVQRQSS